MAKLGIIAGAGSLPGEIIQACRESGREFFVLAFKGSAEPETIGDVPAEWIRMSGLSKGLAAARREGVEEMVLVGKIPRPSITELMRDMRSARFLAKVGTRMLGDDNILSAVIRELEEAEGFRVVAPETILGDILATAGTYGRCKPDAVSQTDIRRGMEVARLIGQLDIGQAAIVQNGTVLGIEGVEGTDELVRRCAAFVDPALGGGVLVKTAKPGQERRTDLPAIGVQTVERVSAAGLRGIAVEAGSALIVGRTEVVSAADGAGIFVVGVAQDG